MTRGRKSSRTRIPNEQWTLPAGIHRTSGLSATLREIADPDVPTVGFDALSRRRRAELVAERIRRQARFRLWMLGRGYVSKRQAIDAVRARTPLGETLIRVEQRLIDFVATEARRRRRKQKRGRVKSGSRDRGQRRGR